MILGAYYMTVIVDGLDGEGKSFANQDEAIMAHETGLLNLRAKIKVLIDKELVETSVGQILFNQIVPEGLGYQVGVMDKKAIAKLIQRSFNELGTLPTAEFVDDLKNIGFKYAERSGITFSLSDIVVPASKQEYLDRAESKLDEVDKQYRRGLITKDEQYVKTVETWLETSKELEHEVMKGFDDHNPIMTIFRSGARGAVTNINQIAGMKGLVANPSGAIIEIPLKNNFKEGLSVFEYFISTHGSRKGRADTALRTADAGYLTRRLVDVAQDVVVAQDDCAAKQGIFLYREDQTTLGETFEAALIGRYTWGENLDIKPGTLIDEDIATKLAESKLERIGVRSPLYCEAKWGICQKCYGNNLATGKLVEHGEAVGIIAAQAIGEPGTQLTMKTFHMGGVAQTGGDITSGLPRVEELFEARSPKTPAIVSEIAGKVTVDERPEETIVTLASTQPAKQVLAVPPGYKIIVAAGDTLQVRDVIAEAESGHSLRATVHGKVAIDEGVVTVTAREKEERQYSLPASASVMVESGQTVEKGHPLTEGHIDLQQLLHLCGRGAVERYIVGEVQKIYFSQGQSINNKHIEIIVRQMLSKVQVMDPGKGQYITGQTVDLPDIRHEMEKSKIKAEQMLLGITRISLWTKSFLSAASFQETTGVLINAAVQGKRDELRGLKENVIIGKLIPAGTGYGLEDQKR
jgi:DNA-directed RNA polymerase subunit beta'